MRASRLAVLFFLLYVGLDFSSPLIPGAVSFDPDESVEGVRTGRVAAPDEGAGTRPAPAPARLQPLRLERPAPVRPPGPDGPRERLVRIRRTPAPAPASARSSDDH